MIRYAYTTDYTLPAGEDLSPRENALNHVQVSDQTSQCDDSSNVCRYMPSEPSTAFPASKS